MSAMPLGLRCWLVSLLSCLALTLASPADAKPKLWSSGPGVEQFDGTRTLEVGRQDVPRRFSVSAWVLPERSQRYQHLLEVGVRERGWAGAVRLAVGVQGEWHVGIGDGASYREASVRGSYELGSWVFVTVTYDGNEVTVYENGKKLFAFLADLRVERGSGTLIVGSNRGKDRFFVGSLSQLSLWSHALSPKEVARLARKRPAETLPKDPAPEQPEEPAPDEPAPEK